MSSGDTGFIMLCSALVFLMTPGLAFFYGGLVLRKNVVNTMMACVSIMGLTIVMWVLFGYSLSFGGDHAGIIGDFRYFGFQNVGTDAGPYADSIPHLVFAAFQMMFSVITPALITGAVVGRMRFKALFLFIAFWSVIVYYPMAHMARWDGLFFGDSHLFVAQLISIVVTIAVAICGTLICITLVRIFTPLRVHVSDEISGMDFSQHGENAYPSFNGFDS